MLSKYYTGDTYKKYGFVDDIEDIQKLIEFIVGTPEVLKHIKTYGKFAIIAVDKNMFSYIELVYIEKIDSVNSTNLLSYILGALDGDGLLLDNTIDLLKDYSSCISSVERIAPSDKALVISIDYVNIEGDSRARTDTIRRGFDIVGRIYYLLKEQSWVMHVSIKEDIKAMRLAKILLDYYTEDDLGMEILLHGHLPLIIKKDWYWCSAIRVVHLPEDSYKDGLDFDKIVYTISNKLLGVIGGVEWVDIFSFDPTKDYLQSNSKLIRKLLDMFDDGNSVIKLAYVREGNKDDKHTIIDCKLGGLFNNLWCESERMSKLLGVEVDGKLVTLEELLV
mgnify:FL=1